MKWKDQARVLDRIVEVSVSRAGKGDAFRAEQRSSRLVLVALGCAQESGNIHEATRVSADPPLLARRTNRADQPL